MLPAPLDGYFVVDLSTGIAGAYCTKILADAGAEVTKIEAPEGDPLRRWSASGTAVADDDDGALFSYLGCSKRSVVADPESAGDIDNVRGLIAGADAIVWSSGSRLTGHAALSPSAVADLAPHATVCAITPFGLDGPWADRPATEATMQAMAGGPMTRGEPGRPPVIMGGRIGDWAAGMTAAVGLLISRWRSLRTAAGEVVDVSEYEALVSTMAMYPVTYDSVAGRPMRVNRVMNLPAIHATKDGFVGFMVVTGQQWLDFCVMLEQPGWLDDPSLLRFDTRNSRRAELVAAVDDWMAEHTSQEVIELANALRIPVAEIGDGATVPYFEQLAARHWYVRNPRHGFLQPDVPYTFHGSTARRAPEPAPRLGEHTAAHHERTIRINRPRPARGPVTGDELPLAGLRVVDFTANWAGPVASHILAMFGADVIHVESVARPDAMRFNTIRSLRDDQWWEWSPLFHGPNTNKRGLTLDMSSERGRDLARGLIVHCDILIENFSPRVVEAWGLGYDEIRKVQPDIIMVRAPAFGTSGPWRDRTGYAQTMEMASGLAWMTGWGDAPPEIPNGPMDPIAGNHAVVATLLALEHRRRTGKGMFVEVPMIGGALNVAAEQVIEYSATGALLTRSGNRSPSAAPQGAYRTADVLPTTGERDRWVFISVERDEQWAALRRVLGDPDWARDRALTTCAGRQQAQDRIDAELAVWCETRSSDEVVETLVASGVPAAGVLLQHEPGKVQQLHARGFWETVTHPITGTNVFSGYPARLANGPARLNRRHAPTLGQHNREILTGLLGLSDSAVDALEGDGVIGTRPGNGGNAW
ncbi:CoA transferase [Frankia sp. Cppng1_Ct_nod]|uniref:CaiB/BaiF CoA transferase family protein n=1 Tax=Frankia sp. Cppng1_Ct_nod TaxID=2897162 RepID=UPI001041ABCB|nr:CoA transferase [Frankia sp. Cppng1_Ct_nod]